MRKILRRQAREELLQNKRGHLAQHLPAERDGFVFPSGRSYSGHYTAFLHDHRRACRKAKLNPKELVPYSCRHTALTRLGAAGLNPFLLASIAGHTNIRTTKRYVHPNRTDVERALIALQLKS